MNRKSFFYPYIARVLLLAILWALCAYLFRGEVSIHRVEFVLESIISVSTTLTGFLFTAITLLVGFSSQFYEKIKQSKSATIEVKLRCIEAFSLGVVLPFLCIVCGAITDEGGFISLVWIKAFFFLGVWFLVAFGQLSFYLSHILFEDKRKPQVIQENQKWSGDQSIGE